MAIGVMVVLQFIPIDRSNPETNLKEDFISANNVPENISNIMKDACYDCHSHETVWPWYSYVAPISWSVSGHVTEAREELNFSKWDLYDAKKKDHKLEECVEALTEGWMPESSYVTMHDEAKLSDEVRKDLVVFFKEKREELSGSH